MGSLSSKALFILLMITSSTVVKSVDTDSNNQSFISKVEKRAVSPMLKPWAIMSDIIQHFREDCAIAVASCACMYVYKSEQFGKNSGKALFITTALGGIAYKLGYFSILKNYIASKTQQSEPNQTAFAQ